MAHDPDCVRFVLIEPRRLAARQPDLNGAVHGERLFRLALAALEESGVSEGTLALAGSYPAGLLAEAAGKLRATGFALEDANHALRQARKSKTPRERDEIVRAATATCAAMRRVAEILADPGAAQGVLRGRLLPVTVLMATCAASLP